MIKYITRLIKALNANAHPGDIAHAVSLGLLLSLVPKNNLLWVFLFILIIFVRINKGAFFLSLILFSILVPVTDVLVERLGYMVLSLSVLESVYTVLYQTPFIGLTRFNNTMVAGGLIAGMLAYIPLYVLVRILLSLYREKLQPAITGSKLFAVIMKFPLIKQIHSASELGGRR